jgi:hypothetical protein
MYKRIKPPHDVNWSNPIISDKDQPFFDDLVFTGIQDTPKAEKVHRIFELFYSEERENGSIDIDKFNSFLDHPYTNLFVIWGDIGIGKTFFVRQQIFQLNSSSKIHHGIIDLLRGSFSDIKLSIYRQLCPIIERNLSKRYGSVKAAALPLGRDEAKKGWVVM